MNRVILGAIIVLCGFALGSCTVRPLYSDGGGNLAATGGVSKQKLAAVSVSAPHNRVEQQVRNELIFLLRGGAAEPQNPSYTMDVRVTSSDVATEVSTQSTRLLNATYILRDAGSGAEIGRGRRSIASAYDIGGQEFALLRAKRDAEDRAARELAQILLAAIASDLARR